MKASFAGLVLMAAVSLAGCASTGERGAASGGVDVMRTHLGQQLARAQIAVEPLNAADANNPEFAAFAQAVEAQLARHGYTIAPNRAQSEQIARIDIRQGSRAALTADWPDDLSPGASGSDHIATLLDVRIQRRSDGSVFWQGRAISEARAGSEEAQRPAAVARLAEALFRDFPGESGRTIRVR